MDRPPPNFPDGIVVEDLWASNEDAADLAAVDEQVRALFAAHGSIAYLPPEESPTAYS